jgi:hypothetical protein
MTEAMELNQQELKVPGAVALPERAAHLTSPQVAKASEGNRIASQSTTHIENLTLSRTIISAVRKANPVVMDLTWDCCRVI